MAPFYLTLCSELQQPVDEDLMGKLKAANEAELEKLDATIEDAEKNFGEMESRDALMKKAEYLCRIGNKVGLTLAFLYATPSSSTPSFSPGGCCKYVQASI